MKPVSVRWKFLLITCVVLFSLVAAAGWFSRSTWLTWYYVRELKKADENGRDAWVERVVGLDEAALPSLLGCLEDTDAQATRNVGLALAGLGARWGPDRSRTAELAARLSTAFPKMSLEGQAAALQIEATWLRGDRQLRPEILESALQMVQEGLDSPGKDVRGTGYELLNLLVRRNRIDRQLGPCRELVRRGLSEQDPVLRALAVRAAEVPELELLDQIAPLLHDPSEKVRRAAVLAVGPAATAVPDEDLLPGLNDDDTEVRLLSEAALRSRGIPDRSIRLARLITHPRYTVRLEAIQELMLTPESAEGTSHARGNASRVMLDAEPDPTEWYRRLTHDTHPSVQVAALRAAWSSRVEARLKDRMREIADNDPSLTVRQLALYYLNHR